MNRDANQAAAMLPVAAATTVTVTDVLPTGLTYSSATGTNWACANAAGTVTCTRTGGNTVLAVGASYPAITLNVTVAATAPFSVTNTAAQMKTAGKVYEPVVYDGAGHGFMRGGEKEFPNATDADKKARDAAWLRWKDLLKKI